MTYSKIDVPKNTNKKSPGAGADKKSKITIIDLADLTAEAARDAAGILITGNHVFAANTYAIEIYATPDTISGKSTIEGDIDAENFIQELIFAHPGSAKEIREFRSNWLNKNILAFVTHCSDGSVDQYGSTCAPLRMKMEAVDDKDTSKSVFSLTSANKGPDVAIYQGTLTMSSVADTVAADATSVDLANGPGEYQLTDNTGATELTTCTNAVAGRVFTLLGSGGSNPASITDANDFVLVNGTSWSGIANAKITFQAFKDGAASWKFFELSRS